MDLVCYFANSVEKTLPRLVEKIYLQRNEVVILTPSKERAFAIDQTLWTYTPLSFIPHGCEYRDCQPNDHPVWITTTLDNINNGKVLVLVDKILVKIPKDLFEKVVILLNEDDHEFAESICKDFENCSFWEQTDAGWQSLPSLNPKKI